MTWYDLCICIGYPQVAFYIVLIPYDIYGLVHGSSFPTMGWCCQMEASDVTTFSQCWLIIVKDGLTLGKDSWR